MEEIEIASLERLVGSPVGSPLFARLADAYLSQGRAEDALRVCDEGIAIFPWYSTAHFVKGRILLALNMTSEARREFEFVRDWMPTNVTVWSILDAMPLPDDQSITAPPSQDHPVSVAEPFSPVEAPTPEPAGDVFGASWSTGSTESPSGDAASEPSHDNVFGLPSEPPTIVPDASSEQTPPAFSAFSGFGQTTESASAETFGSFATAPETAAAFPTEGETFEQFAERTRPTLGPTGVETLEDYLASVETQAPTVDPSSSYTAPPEPLPAVPASDIFTSMTTAAEPGSSPSSADPFAAFTSAPSQETPSSDPFGTFTMPSASEVPVSDPFAAFTETPAPEPAAPESPASDAFSFGGFPAAEEPSSPIADSPSAVESPSFDFSGFPSGVPATEESAPPSAPEPTIDLTAPAFEGPDLSQISPPPPSGGSSIEELTEKLQSAKRITPVIDFTSKTSSTSSEDTLASSGFVTPTLAEIYAKQGWLDDAIKAYRTLVRTKPAEKDKYEARIAELEEEKKKQG